MMNQTDYFEYQLRQHCNIEHNPNTGEEVVKTSLSAVLIAFDEWYKNYIRFAGKNNDLFDKIASPPAFKGFRDE